MNRRNHKGFSPLHVAAYNKSPEIIRLLISQVANVNISSSAGLTPLHKAIERSSISEIEFAKSPIYVEAEVHSVELLISKGADVNARDKNGFTPLMKAATDGNRDIVEILIFHGANVNEKDSLYDMTPLLWALKAAMMTAKSLESAPPEAREEALRWKGEWHDVAME